MDINKLLTNLGGGDDLSANMNPATRIYYNWLMQAMQPPNPNGGLTTSPAPLSNKATAAFNAKYGRPQPQGGYTARPATRKQIVEEGWEAPRPQDLYQFMRERTMPETPASYYLPPPAKPLLPPPSPASLYEHMAMPETTATDGWLRGFAQPKPDLPPRPPRSQLYGYKPAEPQF